MRVFIVAANWKMNLNTLEIKKFFSEFNSLLHSDFQNHTVICPSHPYLLLCKELCQNTNIKIGAQNCHELDSGAFTGEVSIPQLLDLKVSHILIGHSERRVIYKESDELINLKLDKVIKNGITPIFCIGETLSQREAQETFKVLESQIKIGLKNIDLKAPLIIAYEPVWAIGTGKVASPDQAEEAHQFVRKTLFNLGGSTLSDSVPILYGGSVKPDNVQDLAFKPNIDGFLVGGASLKANSFAHIANTRKA